MLLSALVNEENQTSLLAFHPPARSSFQHLIWNLNYIFFHLCRHAIRKGQFPMLKDVKYVAIQIFVMLMDVGNMVNIDQCFEHKHPKQNEKNSPLLFLLFSLLNKHFIVLSQIMPIITGDCKVYFNLKYEFYFNHAYV